VTDPAPLRTRLAREQWRLTVLLRALLPHPADAAAAWEETVARIGRQAGQAAADAFSDRAADVARAVVADRRVAARVSFSDDLCRQLTTSALAWRDDPADRARALTEVVRQLPPPERELLRRAYALELTADQIAASEGRPAAAVVRDLGGLHETLVQAVRAAARDGGPDPPGGAADLGRLAQRVLTGASGEDSRIVLETLLLADTPAQAHYLRHVALLADLTWAYRGRPPIPDLPASPPSRPPLTRREWAVTIAFVGACVAAAAFIVLLVSGALG
jgi:DNA-directed RNA polymerase specialized sigma24 family protein